MGNFTRKTLRTPTDFIFYLYNILIFLFILINVRKIDNSAVLMLSHFIIVTIYYYISNLNNYQKKPGKYNNYLKIFFIISSLTFLHYESGLINLVIFPDYFDDLIRNLDLKIFGFPIYKIGANYQNNSFLVQILHLAYMTYYFLLLMPVLLIYKNQSNSRIYFSGKAEKSMFLLLFTMFVCYCIFIIFPVAGPTEIHFKIFNDHGGFVRIINYLYKYGDSAGGAMPSSHVSVSLVVTLFSFRHLKSLAPYILICFILLTISTVFCSFHYGIDAVAGIVFGFGLYYLGKYFYNKLESKLQV